MVPGIIRECYLLAGAVRLWPAQQKSSDCVHVNLCRADSRECQQSPWFYLTSHVARGEKQRWLLTTLHYNLTSRAKNCNIFIQVWNKMVDFCVTKKLKYLIGLRRK